MCLEMHIQIRIKRVVISGMFTNSDDDALLIRYQALYNQITIKHQYLLVSERGHSPLVEPSLAFSSVKSMIPCPPAAPVLAIDEDNVNEFPPILLC